MRVSTMVLLTAVLSAAGAGTAIAQTSGGSAADPTTRQNTVPGPSTQNPADPSAGSYRGAREPTAEPAPGRRAETTLPDDPDPKRALERDAGPQDPNTDTSKQ
jgi:hypothetical protein